MSEDTASDGRQPRPETMGKERLEAFSDGVIAIIITIMVLELKVPHGADLAALHAPCSPMLLSYVLSFIYVGIYWNNHHHMLHAASASTAPSCGPTCICCSGCRSFPFADRLDGREPFRAAARPRSTAWCC